MSENNKQHYGILGWFLLPEEVGEDYPRLGVGLIDHSFGVKKVERGYQFDFSGLLNMGDSILKGRTIDFFGYATLNGEISNNMLLFEKRYDDRRKDVIKYGFTKVGDLWVGKFEERPSQRLCGDYSFSGQPAQAQIIKLIDSTNDQRLLIAPERQKK